MGKQEYALIVAGGKGTRIRSTIPKQFMKLGGRPVILHTIDAFLRYSETITIILVLPPDDIETWTEISSSHECKASVILATGGETRFQSVRKGLEKIDRDGLVAIHDGVRPLVSESIISDSFRYAQLHGAAVAAVPLKESIREVGDKSSKALDRSRYQLIQTPQTFAVYLIREAYRMPEDPLLTDDASVAERAGHSIYLFQGSYENIKITTAEDFLVAEAILSRKVGL